MKTWRFNGENWYCDSRSLWKRCRQWLIWLGGWEKANGAGWDFALSGPAPVSIFGHKATYFGWGLQVELRQGYLVWSWRHGHKIYISRNGTPDCAHHWLTKPPLEILDQLKKARDGK